MCRNPDTDNDCTEKYYVVSRRDSVTETRKEYGSVQLYDRLKPFSDAQRAKAYARNNAPALIGRAHGGAYEGKLLVIAEHYGKYSSSSYDGSSDWLRTYDVHRCSAEGIEGVLDQVSRESHLERIIVAEEVPVWR